MATPGKSRDETTGPPPSLSGARAPYHLQGCRNRGAGEHERRVRGAAETDAPARWRRRGPPGASTTGRGEGRAASMSAPFRLRVESGPRAGQTFAVGGSGTTIGRQEGNDIVIDDARLSRQHARLELRDGILVVADLGSANGTRVNGRAVTGSQPLRPGDVLQMGQSTLRVEPGGGAPAGSPDRAGGMATLVEDLSTGPTQALAATRTPRLILQNGLNAGREYPLDRDSLTIGRQEGNAIALDDTQASRQHARLDVRGGQISVTDLGSANGTRVNGERIGETRALRPGDMLQIGTSILKLDAPPGAAPESAKDLVTAPPPPPPQPSPPYAGPSPAAGSPPPPAPLAVPPPALAGAGRRPANRLPLILAAIFGLLLVCVAAGGALALVARSRLSQAA